MTESLETKKMFEDLKLQIDAEKKLRYEADTNMRKAAEYGQQLISDLSELKLRKEKADQDIYDLKNKLEREKHTYSALEKDSAEDTENLKNANAKLLSEKEIADLQYNGKIAKLVKEQKIKEIELETTVEKLKENLKLTSEELKEAQDRLLKECGTKDTSTENQNTTTSEEFEILQEKLSQFQENNFQLTQNSINLKEENSELLDRVQTLQNHATELKSSLEESEAESIGYQQSLSQIRNDFASMQKDLTDSSPNETRIDRGNSLFSEVDDRRQIVEGKLKRFKDQFESMKLQYDKKAQQLMKVKTQNVALLNRASANDMNPDHGQLIHLQDLLERERNKNKLLTNLVENLRCENSSSANRGQSDDSSNTHDLLQLQIRQNLEADEKLRELTRTLAVTERNESKFKADNYQLRAELSDLKHRVSSSDKSGKYDPNVKTKSGPIREYINFDSNETKENISDNRRIETRKLIETLSANSTNIENIASNNGMEKENFGLKPKKAQFSDADPVICGDADHSTHSIYDSEDLVGNNFQKKKPSVSGARGKKITNSLINAKEESDKLKEQCAQQ